jgi:hypothetical protein
MFSPIKNATESNKSHNWLELKDDSSDDDGPPPRAMQKIEPVITILAKKTPTLPIHEASPTVPEPPKKSGIDAFLEDDRRALTEKTILPPTVVSNNKATDFWLDDRTISTKRPATAGPPKTPLFPDNQQMKSSTKSVFDSKTDFGN